MKMKSLINKLFLLGVLSSFVLLYSCGDEEPEEPAVAAPTVTFSVTPNEAIDEAAGTVTVMAGIETTWSFTATIPGGFNRFAIMNPDGSSVIEASSATPTGVTVNGDGTLVTATFTNPGLNVGTIELTVLAVDNVGTGRVTERVITVTATSPPARTQTTTLINPPLDNRDSQTFYSISENRTYSLSEVSDVTDPISENIDFGYFFGAEANLVSPSNYVAFTGLTDIYGNDMNGLPTWGTRNETRLVLTTLANTTEITSVAAVEAAVADIDFDAAELVVEGLEVGQVYAFRTASGAEGLFTVSTLVPGFGSEMTNGVTLDIVLAQAQ